MTRQWTIALVSIVTFFVIIVAVDALLAGAYTLATGGSVNFSATLSNMLFAEGGLILLAGAFIEFFHIGGRDGLIKVPKTLFPVLGRLAEPGSGDTVEIKSPGWLLVFLGGLMIACSLAILLPSGI